MKLRRPYYIAIILGLLLTACSSSNEGMNARLLKENGRATYTEYQSGKPGMWQNQPTGNQSYRNSLTPYPYNYTKTPSIYLNQAEEENEEESVNSLSRRLKKNTPTYKLKGPSGLDNWVDEEITGPNSSSTVD